MRATDFRQFPELFLGEKDKETSPLVKYFEEKGWQHTWDFDKHTKEYWYEIICDDVVVVQVEFDVPLEEMIKDIKDFIPSLKEVKDLDKNTPKIIKDYIEKTLKKTGKSLYIKK